MTTTNSPATESDDSPPECTEKSLFPGLATDPWNRSDTKKAVLIGLLGCLLLFFNLGGYRTFSSHEGFAVVPAREMLESNNYVVPYFAGVPRVKKPPLVYWVNAASAKVWGELNEWTARTPQAIAALLLALLVGVWGTQWYGKQVGLAAALVQISSLYVIDFGRKAEIDMTLCLLTTSAMYLIATANPKATWKQSFGRISLIYAILSITWLAKFHYGPAMVILPAVIYFTVQKRYGDFTKMLNPLGMVLAAAAILIWPYLLLQQIPGAWEVWRSETVGRAVGEMSRAPVWYYLPHILALMLPWTIFVVAAWPQSWKRAWKQGDAHERFLWVWFFVQLAILSLQANKHKHYLMSMLPLLALMAGTQLTRYREFLPWSTQFFSRWRAAIFGVLTTAASVGVAVVISSRWPHLQTAGIILGVTLGVGFLVTLWLSHLQKSISSVSVMGATCVIVLLIVNAQVIPGRDHRAPAARFAGEIRAAVGESPEITTYNMGEWDPFLFYLGRNVQRMQSPEEVASYVHQKEYVQMLAYESDTELLSQQCETRVIRKMELEPGEVSPKHEMLVWLELKPINELALRKP